MIEVAFSIKFQSQLRRTRGEIVRSLHDSMVSAIVETGGRPAKDARIVSALYDDGALAFPLDLACALADLKDALERAIPEFYGHALLVKDQNQAVDASTLRGLYGAAAHWGIWCDAPVRRLLEPYAEFDDPLIAGFKELSAFKAPVTAASAHPPSPIEEGSPASRSCAFLVGDDIAGSPSLYALYCREGPGLPPFLVSFGFGGTGPACISDGLTPDLQGLLYPGDSAFPFDRIRQLRETRLRETEDGAFLEESEEILRAVLSRYGEYAESRNATGVVVFEYLHRADPAVRASALRLSAFCLKYPSLRIYAGASDEDVLAPWHNLGIPVYRIAGEKTASPPAMGGEFRELIFCIESVLPCLAPWELPALLAEEGRSRKTVDTALALLVRQGLILSPDRPIPIFQDSEGAGALLNRNRRELVRSFVCRRLLAHIEDGRIAPTFKLLKALHVLGCECGDDLMLDAIDMDIRYGAYKGILESIGNGDFSKIVGHKRGASLKALVPTAIALLHGDAAAVRDTVSRTLPEEYPSPRCESYMLCDRAAFHLGEGDLAAAQAMVKDAILRIQDLRNNRGLARAYRLFALINIAQQRIGDGIEYLDFALDMAEKNLDGYEGTICSLYMAAAQFLTGNYSKAERCALRAESLAAEEDLRPWNRRGRFFRARILFETGRYHDAETLFGTIGGELGARWARRCALFIGLDSSGRTTDIPLNREDVLFAAEAAFLSGRYDEVINLTDPAAVPSANKEFALVEQADANGGFAHCEDLAFPRGDFIDRHLSMFRAMALSKAGADSMPQRDESLNLLHRLLKEEHVPEADPYDPFYYYAHYRVLKDTGASELDISTALSVAFKRLQRRAGRTDEFEVKRSYLFLNRWNGELMAAAKAHNLI